LFDLFDVPWDRLERSHLERFLESAGEEGVTWEAKGARRESGEAPRSDSIRKAACGLANQIGGYLIVGARRIDGTWRLDGIPRPADEPALWLGQILRGLQPVPRFEIAGPFELDNGRVAVVAQIEPVAIPPCMTPQGRIYERVSGETLPVEDPALLDHLFRRGDHARSRAEQFARGAAEKAIEIPDWIPERSISLCVGLASVGRETDDISARLFTEAVHDMVVEGIWALHGDYQPQGLDVRPAQDAYIGTIDSPRNNHFDTDGKTVLSVIRASRFIRANWDGSVAVGLWSADDFAPSTADPEALIAQCWEIGSKINARLGGYGPAYLSVRVVVAKSGEVEVVGQQARAAGRPPPPGTLYARLPALTIVGRLLDTAEPDSAVVESIGREIQRSGGRRADEPGLTT
jgi:hypothetical protein